MTNAGWLFVLTASAFVVFVLWLALSKFGNIPLGRDDEEPEFRTVSWVAMMFSAGMGIGLMFYGVSEPITHFATPPPGTGEAGNPEAAQTAMATTLFHWTLHPWAIYAVVGLAIAYGVYRKGRLQLISSAFEPLLGEHAERPGAARSSTCSRSSRPCSAPPPRSASAPSRSSSGLEIVGRHRRGRQRRADRHHRGPHRRLRAVRRLRRRQGHPVALQHQHGAGHRAGALRVRRRPDDVHPQPGPDLDRQLRRATCAMMSARTSAEGAATSDWLAAWTVFYWAWWLSWTPFVGMFIARISRGRTIRQFVTGVLLVPSLVSLVWFCIFGGAAIDLQKTGTDIAGAGGAGVAAVQHARRPTRSRPPPACW